MKQVDMSSKNIHISISENLNSFCPKNKRFLQGFILAGHSHLEFLVKPNSHF